MVQEQVLARSNTEGHLNETGNSLLLKQGGIGALKCILVPNSRRNRKGNKPRDTLPQPIGQHQLAAGPHQAQQVEMRMSGLGFLPGLVSTTCLARDLLCDANISTFWSCAGLCPCVANDKAGRGQAARITVRAAKTGK